MTQLRSLQKGVSFLALALGLLSATPSQAESTGQMRLGAGLKYKLRDDLKVTGGTELRLVTGPVPFDSVLPNIGLKYQLLDPLAISVGYRFKYQSDGDDEFDTRNRFSFDVSGKTQFDKIKLNLRLRVQDQIRKTKKGETRHKPTFRTRVGAKWAAWQKFTPWISAEHSLALDEISSAVTRKWRGSIGADWKFATYQLGISYRLDLLVVDDDSPKTHIIGLKANFDPWRN